MGKGPETAVYKTMVSEVININFDRLRRGMLSCSAGLFLFRALG
jgi:hypothetical protein